MREEGKQIEFLMNIKLKIYLVEYLSLQLMSLKHITHYHLKI